MSVLPKLLSVLVLVAARGAVAALNVPVGVQSCVCGSDAALEGVYPFTPCTGDGADVFRPQMAGGPGPLASDVVAWWDRATGRPVWAWRLEAEGCGDGGYNLLNHNCQDFVDAGHARIREPLTS